MSISERYERLLKRTFIDFQQTTEFLENPLIIDRAEGLYYWDIDGKRYFDAIGGIFVAVLGHRHPRLIEALTRQLERLSFAPPLHGISDVALELVDKLGQVTPGDLNFVKAFSGGSESNEAAMKFVRQYFKQTGRPGKYKFISNYLSYHGATFAAMSASGSAKRKVKFEPQMAGFVKAFSPIQLRDRFPSWEQTNRFCAGLLEDLIVNENPDTVAGFLVEPLCNTGGMVNPTEEYFRIVRDICDRYQVMLIFDEVLTGFAKTGRMFAAQTFGVTPDIINAGKGLSGGIIPIGAMMARESMAEAFLGPAADGVQFAHGHTFAGSPLACAVGVAVLDEIREKQLEQHVRGLSAHLVGRLEGLKKYGVVREVRGKGFLHAVELVRDAHTNEPFPANAKLGEALKKTALKNGIILRIDPDWFAVCPPVVATRSDLDEMCDLIEKSLKDALALV